VDEKRDEKDYQYGLKNNKDKKDYIGKRIKKFKHKIEESKSEMKRVTAEFN